MRFGFVAASLTAHAAVVCLAWRFAPVGERAASPRQTSGLPSDELEVTPWEPEAASDDAVRRGVAERDEPPADKAQEGDNGRTRVDDTRLDTATPAREGAPPKIAAPPERDARSKSSPAAPPPNVELGSNARGPVQPRAPRPAANQPHDRDWMNLADQLPDPATVPQETPAQPAPKRDELVERLLAKERDKARLAAREEASARDEAARRNNAGAPKREASPSEPRSRTPDDETFGESRAHADLWVELTRWLPRAASSDPAWEQLPNNASYEFRIELVTEAGKLVGSKVLDAAPTPTKKLLSNTSHLMERGRYPGTKRLVHRFELRIRLSAAEPRDLWIAHTTPDPPKPGVGSFIAPSGRRFDVWVSEID